MFSHSTTLWLLSADRLSSASVKTNRKKKRHEGSAADAAASSRIQRLKRQKKPRWNFGENRRFGVMWVGAHDFLSSSHLQCSKLLCGKLLLAASLPSAAPPQGRCAPRCTGETSHHRAGLPPLHSLPSFALWFSPLPCNPRSCFKMWKEVCPF